jgi:RHS repeat-associated protein
VSQIDYDPYTQMTTAMRTSATELVQFNYDAANERVLKLATSPSKTEATLYLHGLSEYPLVDKVDNGESVYERIYIYGTTGLIAIREGTSETYLIRDHLGSTRLAIAQDGSAGYAYSYDALGKIIAEGSWGNAKSLAWARYFYTGQERDEETGLQNFRARFYDEDLFRFYAMDPAGQQTSPYAFVGSSPLMMIDKNGEEFFTAALLAKIAVKAWAGAKTGMVVSGLGYTAGAALSNGGISNNWKFGDFLKSVALGGMNGAMGGAINGFIGEAMTQITGVKDGIFKLGSFQISPSFSVGSEGLSVGVDVGLEKRSDFLGLTGGARARAGVTVLSSVGELNGFDAGIGVYGGYKNKTGDVSALSSFTAAYRTGSPDFGQLQAGFHLGFTACDQPVTFDYVNDQLVPVVGSGLDTDKGRSFAAELGIGDFSVGMTTLTTDRGGRGINDKTADGQGFYKGGRLLFSSLYFGYKSGGIQASGGVVSPRANHGQDVVYSE